MMLFGKKLSKLWKRLMPDYSTTALTAKIAARTGLRPAENDRLVKAVNNQNELGVIEALWDGADINGEPGKRPLLFAAEHCPSLAMMLINLGADVQVTGADGESAIELAIKDLDGDAAQKLGLMDKLWAKGARVDALNKDGHPGFYNMVYADTRYSAWTSATPRTEWLIAKNADLSVKDRQGLTILDHLQKSMNNPFAYVGQMDRLQSMISNHIEKAAAARAQFEANPTLTARGRVKRLIFKNRTCPINRGR